jgi:hypothetical protein
MPIHGYPGGVISATPPTVSVSSASGVWTTEKQLQYQAQGVWPPGGVYPITRSLRFNSADSAYLSRTPASAGNQKVFTWSAWYKRGILSTGMTFFGANTTSGSRFSWEINSSDALNIAFNPSATWYEVTTAAVFRDPSAWYHIVVACDLSQATSSNRVKVYVNGVQQTLTGTYPPDYSSFINSTGGHQIGRYAATAYYDGLLTEINFIDGQQLTPSSFGQTNSNTGVWEPKPYTGTYGTNGFYLNFSDNSGTTSTTLGKDYSGNGNNWTPNNFSVTAGTGNDSLVDTPTSYGSDTGAGGTVRGNYCTLNPLKNGGVTLTNGNLDAAKATSGWVSTVGTIGVSSGKWYWEVTTVQVNPSNEVLHGIATAQASMANYVGADAYGWCYYSASGNKINNGSSVAYGATYTNGDIIGVALDLDAGTVTFYKNGVSQGVAYSSLSGEFFPAVSGHNGNSVACNFGQRPFAYTAPSGFKSLCTQNLPTPTVVQGDDYFNTVLYTGTGSSLSVTGVGFQPDFTWIKGRSGATDHGLYDAVRGVQKQLESNTTTAETTETTGLTAFGTDGFTVGALAQLNTNTATYVGWNWKANGAGSSNTAGTITSTVSANTTSGFSVVTYTGTGANATVGHGLGAAPGLVIVKGRNFSASGWIVWHSALSGTEYLSLESTNSVGSNATVWNSTVPTSTVFSLGTNSQVNGSGNTYVAYCFAAIPGFSAFGSYTGNGSADGAFVYTGFRPAWLLVKRTNLNGYWTLVDAKRNTYNVMGEWLYPNAADAGATNTSFDFVSNGFKLRYTGGDANASGSTYIYAAFAENPFKYALAR